jgi:hypothetical protein
MNKTVHLGFEVGTGGPVEIPLLNICITGQTQASGKTTTLEAIVSRANVPAIAFVTKRGEGAFRSCERIRPYFRDRADWQFVVSLLDATLQEKNKFLRSWIIKLCRTTRTLADVQREVKKELKTAKGISEGVYTQLDAYLDLIVPEIERADLAESIALTPGLNVMDVSIYPTPMQMLFVQSAIDWVNDHLGGTLVIVPEAWEMIPEGKGSPVKASAISLARKGSGLGNHILIDSQDMAGVDKTVLRGCPVWLIGVQREANEIKRNLSNIPAGIKRPTPADIANLDRGQFYACWKDRTVKVYVQPAWMDERDARDIATGVQSLPANRQKPSVIKEPSVTQQQAEQLTEENRQLKAEVKMLLQQVQQLQERQAETTTTFTLPPVDEEALFELFKTRLMKEAPALLQVVTARPELTIKVQRKVIEMDEGTAPGRVAILIQEGFFDEVISANAAFVELKRRGFSCAVPTIYSACDKLNALGFLFKMSGGYQAVSGMKVNIIEAA